MHEEIDAYLQHLTVIRGLAEKTVEAYGSDLLFFKDFLTDLNGSIGKIDEQSAAFAAGGSSGAAA